MIPPARSPVDDALDRLASIGWLSPEEAQDLATVRAELQLRQEIAWGYEEERDRLQAEVQRLREERDAYRIEGDHGHDDYEDAEDIIRQIAEKRPNQSFDPWASGLCQEFLDRPRRSRATIATIRDRAEAAEDKVQRRDGLRELSETNWRALLAGSEAEPDEGGEA